MASSTRQVNRRQIDIALPIGLFLFALGTRVAYWVVKGRGYASDTSDYIEVCGLLQQNFVAALQSEVGIEYLGFTAPFCVFNNFFNSFEVWIMMQGLLSAVSCVLVYFTAKKTINQMAGIAAGGTLAILYDSFYWYAYILTDSFFVFVVTVVLWAMATHYVRDTSRTRVLALSSLGYLAITRPFGIPIFLCVVVGDQFTSELNLLPKFRATVPLVVAASGAVILFSQRISWVLEHVTESFASGTLVANDSMLVYPFIEEGTVSLSYLLWNIHHIILIAISRVLVFFLPILPRYSMMHNIVNIVTLVPMMLFAAVGVVRLIRRRKSPLLLMWLVPLIAILLTVSVTFVDWDWRYRAPAGPLLAVLAGYTVGTDSRIAGLRRRLKTEIQSPM